MADAILPVPIYDSQYKTLTELCLNAKRLYSFKFSQVSYALSIQTFEICIICNMIMTGYTNSSYSQRIPAMIILSNSQISFGLTFDSGDASPSIIQISTSSDTINFNTPSSTYTYNGIVAVIE